MTPRTQNFACAAALVVLSASHAHAAVTADEAQQLGASLTPWGATQAGNADGSIPAYTGTVKPPASYDPKNPGFRPDPFADEKPLFSIDGKNLQQYADKLAEGTKSMLQKYPEYRIDVYPSHRTANYPDWVNANSIENATRCNTINDGLGVENCFGGIPFPIPKTGSEVMWNKLLQFEAPATYGISRSWLVDSSGKAVLQGENKMWIQMPYYDKDKSSIGPTDSYWLYRHLSTAPARKAGEALLLHDSIDMVNTGRRAWQYIPGQRRIKLAPDLAYDTPNPQSGGKANMDDSTLFLGAMDRFDWKLIGKEEKYIPYNNFKLKDPGQCPSTKVLIKNFFNPDCVRWELHRVWVVEATLKPGVRHNYHKRTLYLDEDVFTGLADNYDASGQLYRMSNSFFVSRYESEGHDGYMTVTYDIPSSGYTTSGFYTDTGGSVTSAKRDSRFWSPDSLSATGIR
jgi:hypothetical protein